MDEPKERIGLEVESLADELFTVSDFLFVIWILKFICDLVLAICYFRFIRV